ncbi:MAG: hypothetical protein FD168_1507 [Desulfobulbaceae bacterium]|nr:MAG: hypothetical protein FD168_1507 [Desulfobulbaceae bacterium]
MSADKEVHNQHDHQILLSGIALGNHQGQCHHSVIIDDGMVKQIVLFQEPQAEKRRQLPGCLSPQQEIVLERLDGFPGPAIIK